MASWQQSRQVSKFFDLLCQRRAKFAQERKYYLGLRKLLLFFYVLITAALIQFVAVLIRYTARDVQVFLRWQKVVMQIRSRKRKCAVGDLTRNTKLNIFLEEYNNTYINILFHL